jgi:hypothetical protein
MKARPILISVLALGLMLALAAGLGLAQGPGPQGDAGIQAAPVSTSFTYQGRLNDGSSPANGSYDFEFKLYNAASSGSQVGSTVTRDDRTVTDGLFTVELDFGSGVFTGDARWLEIGVRPGDSTGAYTALTPRQALTATPYALYALDADLLDGQQASAFASATHNHMGGTWTGNTPLTISGSFDPAPLVLNNGGGGAASGLALNPGDGLLIESADDDGVQIDSAGQDGVIVLENGRDAFSAVDAGGDGLYVKKAGDDGVDVREAGDNGVVVESAGADGVHVANAWDDGVYVDYADDDGVQIDDAGDDGVSVYSAGDDGLFVNRADDDGVEVKSAGGDGVHVTSATNAGVLVEEAYQDGVFVDMAHDDGFDVDWADRYGVRVGGAGSHGVYVKSASFGAGVHVKSAKYGLWVQDSEFAGVHVFSDDIGVVASTANANGEWGFWTNDKMFAGSGYNDIAEHIDASSDVEPGDVVVIDPHHDERVVKSTKAYDTSVAGIISTDPALLIGKSDTETPLSLAGRVPCKVSAENGSIHRGDLLTTSSTPGHAMKATEPQLGTILGKALGELESGTGVIPVLVTLQ